MVLMVVEKRAEEAWPKTFTVRPRNQTRHRRALGYCGFVLVYRASCAQKQDASVVRIRVVRADHAGYRPSRGVTLQMSTLD